MAALGVSLMLVPGAAAQVSVPAAADCSIYSDFGDDNYCGDTDLNVGRWAAVAGHPVNTLLRFDTAAAVPAGEHIDSATLNLALMGQLDADNDLDVRPLTSAWDNAATWNNRTATQAWTTSGGDTGDELDRTEFNNANPQSWVSWDVSTLVADWTAGRTPNVGMLVESAEPSDLYATFASSEAGGGLAPYLDIVHHPNIGLNSAFGYESLALGDNSTLSVNLGNGNLTLSAQDMYDESVGADLDFHRYYNSLDDESGQFGPGTRLSLGRDIKLTECGTRGNRCLVGPSGVRATFRRNDDDSFSAPPDFQGTLVRNGDGSFELTIADTGLVYHFAAGSDPALQRLGESGANEQALTYGGVGGTLTGVDDDDGHAVSVHSNVAGKIDQISESALGTWTYGYTSGRLTSVASPSGTTTYGYNGSGRLATLNDGTADWAITYDGSGRVSQISRTDGSGTRSVTFAYASPSSPCAGSDLVKTTVTYGAGTPYVYCVDAGLQITHGNNPGAPDDIAHDDAYEEDDPPDDTDDSANDPTVGETCDADTELGAWDYCPQTDDPPGSDGEDGFAARGLSSALEPGGSGWGISEPRVSAFSDLLFASLKPKHARLIISWNDAQLGLKASRMSSDGNVVDDYNQLQYIRDYVAAAKSAGVDVTISLQVARKRNKSGSSAETDSHQKHWLPSIHEYRVAFDALLRAVPSVHTFTPWNEPNSAAQPPSYSNRLAAGESRSTGPKRAAQYFKQMKSVCKKRHRSCTVAAGDFVDDRDLNRAESASIASYLDAYLSALGRSHVAYWAIHTYRAGSYTPGHTSRRTPFHKFLSRTENYDSSSHVWITEYGQRTDVYPDDSTSSGMTRRKNLRYMLEDLDVSARITRFYYYRFTDWNDHNSTRDPWSSGLIGSNANGTVIAAKCLFYIYRYETNPAATSPAVPSTCPSGPAVSATP